jgi:aminoglycoside 6'-N-acetyltransferase I
LPEIIIRPLAPADHNEWLRMRLALWPDHTAEDLSAEMENLLAAETVAVFVAGRPGTGLGGFVEAGTRPYAEDCETSPVGYIEGWYVDPDLRQQGVGGRLIGAAEDWARGLGLQEMASDTWIWNETSIQAHLSLGYCEAERLVTFCKKLT